MQAFSSYPDIVVLPWTPRCKVLLWCAFFRASEWQSCSCITLGLTSVKTSRSLRRRWPSWWITPSETQCLWGRYWRTSGPSHLSVALLISHIIGSCASICRWALHAMSAWLWFCVSKIQVGDLLSRVFGLVIKHKVGWRLPYGWPAPLLWKPFRNRVSKTDLTWHFKPTHTIILSSETVLDSRAGCDCKPHWHCWCLGP